VPNTRLELIVEAAIRSCTTEEAMITFTEAARGKVLELLAGEGRQGSALRFSISGRMGGVFQYRLAFMKPEEREAGDALADAGGFQVVVDERSAPHLAGTAVDYVEAPSQSGFKIDNPNPLWSDPLASAVQRLIDDEINPALASHGGFVHLLELKEGVAHVELGGGCQGCGMAHVTLKRGIEARIREALPEVKEVVDVTDHTGGANPYFRGSESRESPYA
jgi:Fe/S biogenesis protein NfuA